MNSDRWETRKVEIYVDRRRGFYASPYTQVRPQSPAPAGELRKAKACKPAPPRVYSRFLRERLGPGSPLLDGS
ncbi:hypothetical protein [Ralstonia solanacearum]|uniref:hypothetical protein n=1 Tax=Ralstonia solanacearum TaxID=305 RepID=UPI003CC50FA8